MSEAGEVIRSGAADKLADVVHKLAGPMAEEVGLLMADKIKVYRVKNWVDVIRKTKKILAEAKLPLRAAPARIFLPILEASSIENDESLQDLWAGLLATASEQSDSLSPSFIETLRQLTPGNARGLSILFDSVLRHERISSGMVSSLFRSSDDASVQLMMEAFERLGLVRRQYDVQLRERGQTKKTKSCPN